MVTRFVATHTRSGLEMVENECELTKAEQDGFAQFCDRLTEMQVSSSHYDIKHNYQLNSQTIRQPQPNNQLQRVLTSYCETVLDVPHYDEVYNESLPESLAEEFGSEIATVLLTGDHLTASLRKQILTKSQQARDNRADFLDALSQEAESLRSMNNAITKIGTNLDTLNARSLETRPGTDLTKSHEQILAAEEQCEKLAATRQDTLQKSKMPGPTPSDFNLTEYLYESLPVTYPVLTDLADLSNTLYIERSRIEYAIGSN